MHFRNVIAANERMAIISYIEMGLIIGVGPTSFT